MNLTVRPRSQAAGVPATWRLAALLLLAGCDGGFGRAIVGKYADRPPLPPLNECVALPAECHSAPTFTPIAAPPAPVFGLADCGYRSMQCDLIHGSTATLSACELDLTLDPAYAAALKSLSCLRAELTLPANGPSLSLANMMFDQAELVFSASTPVTIELSHAKLNDVRIELRGPITLRLSASSVIQDTQITDTSSSGASVELSESSATALSVLGLRGTLSLLRSNVRQSTFFATTAELETTTLGGVGIVADQLVGVELQGSSINLEFQTGTLSGANLMDVTVQRCGSLLIANSTIYDSIFAACSDKLRADRGAIGRSVVLGAIESHVMIWQADTFGGGVNTSMNAWGSDISGSRFCANTQHFSLVAQQTLACNICEEVQAPPEQWFCQVATAAPSSFAFVVEAPTNYADGGDGVGRNPRCTLFEMLPDCSPVPVDENPF
ncbi:MAG: hypothetical protein JWN04_3925 [Myxococcaceae bacterium]|nr:hypothetical protein [Myxococcaceae bacterium]